MRAPPAAKFAARIADLDRRHRWSVSSDRESRPKRSLPKNLAQDCILPSRPALLILLQICALLLGSGYARAEEARRISLISSAKASAGYYVVFCARRSPDWGPGHAFVVWIQHDTNGVNVQAEAFGFYPQSEAVGPGRLFSKGAIIDESTREASLRRELLTHRYVVRVSREAFQASRQIKAEWSQATFRILRNNCTHFVRDVARRIGLDPPSPSTAEKPADYVSRLMAKMPRRVPVRTRDELIAGRAPAADTSVRQ